MHPRHPPATPRPATTPRSPCVTDRQHDPGYSNFQEPVILCPAELDLHYRLAVPRLERGHIRLRNMSIPVRISLNSRCLAMSFQRKFHPLADQDVAAFEQHAEPVGIGTDRPLMRGKQFAELRQQRGAPPSVPPRPLPVG